MTPGISYECTVTPTNECGNGTPATSPAKSVLSRRQPPARHHLFVAPHKAPAHGMLFLELTRILFQLPTQRQGKLSNQGLSKHPIRNSHS